MSTGVFNESRGAIETYPLAMESPLINMNDAFFHGLGGRKNDRNKSYYNGIITKVEDGVAWCFDETAIFPYSILVLEHILNSGCIRPMQVSTAFGCNFDLPVDLRSGSVASNYVSLSKTGSFHPSFIKYISQNPALVIKKSDLINGEGKIYNEAMFRALGIFDSVQGEYLYNQTIPMDSVLGIFLPPLSPTLQVEDMADYIKMIEALLTHYGINLPIVDCNGIAYKLK